MWEVWQNSKYTLVQNMPSHINVLAYHKRLKKHRYAEVCDEAEQHTQFY
jgi:hypothetical protein